MSRSSLDETFADGALDTDIWLPHYLPHWSSRAASAARWSIAADGLHLIIPPDQPLWCPDRHAEPLRASAIQSGEFAGPVGSTIGQQPFRDGLTVLEAQPTFRGYTPTYGHVGITMRGLVSERSMFALWLAGFEDVPDHSGEICVAEIFGSGIGQGSAEVGVGIKALRDPKLTEDFAAVSLPIDPADFHTYTVDWRPGAVDFLVDGEPICHLDQAPDYPMQLMLGVFDFPARATDVQASAPIPELIIRRLVSRPSAG
jgi:hypothetical protein